MADVRIRAEDSMWAKAGRLLAAVLLGTVVAFAPEVRAQTAHQAETGAAGAAFANAERALAEGRYDEAERLYRDLARQSPDVAEIHAKLGVTYYQEGKYAEAIPALQRALKLKPALPNLDALLAMSQSELGQHAEALPGLKRAFARGGDPALVRAVGLHLQRAYMGLGRDADAVGVALDLSRRYPDDPEVLYHTGRIFSNYAYLQTMRLQRVAPESVWMHQAAGEANESQGFWDAAIREYEQVLAASPNRPGLHFRIGRVLLAQAGQAGSDAPSLTARARQQFELELQRDPTNANAAYELGELQRRAGELEPAVASFGAAVHSDSGFSDALVGLGRTLTTLNRASEAVPLLERATTLDPNSDVAFYLLSQAYGATGNAVGQQRALETFRRLRAQKRGDGPSLGEGRPDVTKQGLPAGPGGG
jgi:tetratricopeptide (TPR) repeat protein